MGAKDHCRVIHCTTGWIKARNPARRLSFSFSKLQSIVFRGADSRMIPGPVCWEWSFIFFTFCSFFLFFFSILFKCTGCALNYYSIYHCCQNEGMYVRERGWGVSNNNTFFIALFPSERAHRACSHTCTYNTFTNILYTCNHIRRITCCCFLGWLSMYVVYIWIQYRALSFIFMLDSRFMTFSLVMFIIIYLFHLKENVACRTWITNEICTCIKDSHIHGCATTDRQD